MFFRNALKQENRDGEATGFINPFENTTFKIEEFHLGPQYIPTLIIFLKFLNIAMNGSFLLSINCCQTSALFPLRLICVSHLFQIKIFSNMKIKIKHFVYVSGVGNFIRLLARSGSNTPGSRD